MAAGPLVIELLVVGILTVLLLHQYGNWRTIPWTVSLFTLFGWYLAFVTVGILPLDVVLTFYRQCISDEHRIVPSITPNLSTIVPSNGSAGHLVSSCKVPVSYVPEQVLINFWKVVYWSGQVLTWLVLPMLQSYSMAGEFTLVGKLKTMLKQNAIYYASYLLLFGVFLIYVAAKGIGLNPEKLKVILITASNTWGLFLLVLLLGYGLVEVPRKLWYSGNRGHELQRCYFDLEKLSVEKNDCDEALKDAFHETEGSFNAFDKAQSHRLRPYAEEIINKFPTELRQRWSRGDRRNEGGDSSTSATIPTEEFLCRLHARVIKLLQQHHRTHAEWDAVMNDAVYLEDVQKNENSAAKSFHHSFPVRKNFVEKFFCFSPHIEWYWACVVKRPFMKALSVSMIIFSVYIVWCEVTFFNPRPVLSLAAIFVSLAADNYDYSFIQLSSLLTMIYLSCCAYFTVFKLKIYRWYQLDPHHHTDSYSLLFSAIMLTRLTPPLCLNFLGLIHLDSHLGNQYSAETSFTKIMGHMDIIGFVADGFNVYFPMFILLLCLGTYLRLGDRLLNWLGFEQFISSDQITAELVQAGRSLVQLERNRYEREQNRAQRDQYWRGGGASPNVTQSASRDSMRSVQSANSHGVSAVKSNESANILGNAEPLGHSEPSHGGGSRQYGTPGTPPGNIFDDI